MRLGWDGDTFVMYRTVYLEADARGIRKTKEETIALDMIEAGEVKKFLVNYYDQRVKERQSAREAGLTKALGEREELIKRLRELDAQLTGDLPK